MITRGLTYRRENSSQETEIRNFDTGHAVSRQDLLLESMEILSSEMNT